MWFSCCASSPACAPDLLVAQTIRHSTVRIEVQKDNPEIAVAENGEHLSAMWSRPLLPLTTQFKIIESYSILTNVINALHLDTKFVGPDDPPFLSLDQAYGMFVQPGFRRAELARMTSLIEISVKNSDPKLAADIANAIVDAYRKSRMDKWRGGSLRRHRGAQRAASPGRNEP